MYAEMWLRGDTEAAIVEALELMGLAEGGRAVRGVGLQMWAAGTLLDGGETPNSQPWCNVLCYNPWTAETVEQAKAAFRSGSTSGTKASANGNGDSQWSVQANSAALFELSYLGNPHPENPRSRWAV